MAQKMDIEQARRILQQGGVDLNPQPDNPAPTWTDGLPHGFSGRGLQTPDPLNPSPAVDLLWTGEGHDHRHQVWLFDGRHR